MTPSDTPEYAWNPRTTASLPEQGPNLCLITDELSPDTVVQGDQHLRYYVNSTIGPLISYDIMSNKIIKQSEPDWKWINST